MAVVKREAWLASGGTLAQVPPPGPPGPRDRGRNLLVAAVDVEAKVRRTASMAFRQFLLSRAVAKIPLLGVLFRFPDGFVLESILAASCINLSGRR